MTHLNQGYETNKTKYKWNSESTSYTSMPDGKIKSMKSGNAVTEFIYDSKGRLVEEKTSRPYEKDMKEPMGLRVVYRYRQ